MAKKIEVLLTLNDRNFVRGIRQAQRALLGLSGTASRTTTTVGGLAGTKGFGGLGAAIAGVAAGLAGSQGGFRAVSTASGKLTDSFKDSFDMVKNNEGVFKESLRSEEFNQAIKGMDKEISNFEKGSGRAGTSIRKTGGGFLKFIGIAALVAAAVATITVAFRALTKSVQTAAQFEDIQITLQNITGSAEAGAYALALVTEEATKLPFAFQDLASATPVLATISKDLGELRENINLSADIAANFGIPFDQAASSLQRAFSAGAGAADVFREKGVLAAAGFEAGVSYSIDETIAKLREFGGPNGIQGAAQTLNTTFSGATSQASDRLTLFNAAIGETTLPFFKATLLELVDAFDSNSDSAFALAKNIGENVVAGFQAAVIGGAYLFDILEAIKTGFVEIITLGGFLDPVFEAAGAALKNFGVRLNDNVLGIDFDKAEMAKQFFKDVGEEASKLKQAGADVKEGAKEIDDSFEIILGSSDEVSTTIKDTRTEFQKLKDAMDISKGASVEEFEAFMLRLNALFEQGEIGIQDYINTKRELDELFGQNEGLNNFLETLGSAQKALSEDLATAFLEGQKAGDAFKNFFKTMITQIIADIIRLQVIQPILGAIMSPFGFGFGTGGSVVKLPGRRNGGPVQAGSAYTVGEDGPETLIMGNQGGTIIPNGQAMGGTTVNYNINAVDAASFKQLVAQDPEFIYNVTRVGARRTPQ